MGKAWRKIGRHGWLWTMEALAATVGIVILAACLLVWRLSTGPVDVSFARDYVEAALRDSGTGRRVALNKLQLEWADFRQPLRLSIGDVTLRQDNRRLLSVQNVQLGVAPLPLLIGRIRPVSVALNNPILRLIRTEDNHIRLSMQAEDAVDSQDDPFADMLDMLSRPASDRSVSGSVLSYLDHVSIDGASIIVEDRYNGLSWYLQNIDLAFGRDADGLAVTARGAMPGGFKGDSKLELSAVYGRDRALKFNLDLSDFNSSIFAGKLRQLDFLADQHVVFDGNISGILGDRLSLQTVAVDLRSGAGSLSIHGVYAQPLSYRDMRLSASYDAKASRLAVDRLEMTAGGVTVAGQGEAAISRDNVAAKIAIRIPKLEQAQIGPLWPDPLQGDGAQKWLVHKLSKGSFSDIVAKLDLNATRAAPVEAEPLPEPKADRTVEPSWAVKAENIEATFAVKDMNVAYRPPLLPIEQASGKGVFADRNLTITIDSAKMADMTVRSGRVFLENVVDAKHGHADIDVRLDGPLKTVFDYIALEPIHMGRDRLGFEAGGVQGQADLAVNVKFPTIRDLPADQVKVRIDSTLDKVLLPGIVSHMDLSGGPFRLEVADAAAKLSGKGQFNGRDIDLIWHRYLNSADKPYASKVTATVSSDRDTRERFGIDLKEWIDGTIPIELVFTEQADKSAVVAVKADLKPGALIVAPLDYRKEPGQPGEISTKVTLVKGDVRKLEDLTIRTADLFVRGGTMNFVKTDEKTKLRSGHLPVARLRETDVALDFTNLENGGTELTAKGRFLDASPFIGKRKRALRDPNKPANPALIASVAVDRMRTTPDQIVSNVELYLDRADGGAINRFELDARAGKSDIYLRMRPDDQGVMRLKLESDDAGAVLQAFDVYKNARGGHLLVEATGPDIKDRTLMRGRAEVTDFHVVDAPVLARLLNAISFSFITDLFGEGLAFSRLDAEFEWAMRPDGDIYVIKDGRTSGASLGLTFEGKIDRQTEVTDINGTIVPVSGVNQLVSDIPLIGEAIAGGNDAGLFAFTYKIEGQADDPAVSVNPLSALAPGFLRKLLFE